MDSDSETEESVAISRTYDKMKSSVHKIGYVEGMTSGKEATFQDGFDRGYKEGFRAGYQLGILNGVLRVFQEGSTVEKNISDAVSNIKMEPDTKRGLCLLCNPENMESCLQSSGVSEDNHSTSLDNNVKLQKEIVQQACSAHYTKMTDVYAFYNITQPLKFPD